MKRPNVKKDVSIILDLTAVCRHCCILRGHGEVGDICKGLLDESLPDYPDWREMAGHEGHMVKPCLRNIPLISIFTMGP